jgi:DNA-directed RNA polymerase specialized sigma24 family protein
MRRAAHGPPMHTSASLATHVAHDANTIAPALRREWQWLRRRPQLVAVARSWHVTELPFEDLDELLALAGYQSAHADGSDVLRGLVERAADDELAARIVLQRILPGLLSVVRRRSPAGRTDGVLEELVGAAWIAIRTFDTRRRPACLAAALICGAEHRAFRGPQRRRAALEVPFDPMRATASGERHVSAADELADVLRSAVAQGLSAEDVEFVRLLVGADSPQQLARSLGVTTRTIRNRRDRVMYRLRRLSVAA